MSKKFIHSGYICGIKNTEFYVFYKVLLTLFGFILSIIVFNSSEIYYSILKMVLITLLGFLVPDLLLELGRINRNKDIIEELPLFLSSVDNYSKAGLLFETLRCHFYACR